MEGIIEIYKISFFEKLINGRLLKSMSSTSEVLDQFLTDYDALKLVDDFVISYIDEVLNAQISEQTMVSQSMVSVRIANTFSEFFQDPDYIPGSIPDFKIPTDHLRQIAMLWRDFLISINRNSKIVNYLSPFSFNLSPPNPIFAVYYFCCNEDFL